MRTHYTLVAICTGVFAHAQVILDQPTDTPQSGESFIYHEMPYTDESGFENMANWDHSGLSGGTTFTVNILAPGSTAQGGSFPGTDYVEQWPSGELRYYASEADGLRLHGVVQNGATIVHEDVSEPRRIQFPLSFTNQWTDLVMANYSNGGTPYYRYGNVYGNAEGFGTLVMPYGSYFPVLKLNYTEVISDFGPDTTTHTVNTIGFYYGGVHQPVVFSRTDVATNWNGDTLSSSANMYWLDDASIGMSEHALRTLNATVFPNPADDQAVVSLDRKVDGVLDVVLQDAIGRPVIRFTRAGLPSNRFDLPLADVATGTYLVTITDGNGARCCLPLVVK